MNPVWLGSALRCGKTCVLARGTTQSSTWYNTCIDEKPSVAWLARQATTGVRNSPANGWEGVIEYENQMQFSNRVVKGQTGPNPLRPRAAAPGLPDDAAEPLELALARDLAGVELRALNRGSILSHNQPDKLRFTMRNGITKTEEKCMLTSTAISRPPARGIEPETRAFLRRLALEGTPGLEVPGHRVVVEHDRRITHAIDKLWSLLCYRMH
jgi:hypothetical protein